ncbi:MAG TPA: vanadium-dependent haloperoxidase [Falsiroseomonas sp.]|jgi:hypothetical protein|nr:vanadium-dependent haloperoxidase [Falsiroseomonas sp.]
MSDDVICRPTPGRANRHERALRQRHAATEIARARGHGETRANGEELRYGGTRALNYHKGLPHDDDGFVDNTAYRAYVKAVSACDHEALRHLPLGENYPTSGTGSVRHTVLAAPAGSVAEPLKRRKLTSPLTGHAYDLMGIDAGDTAIDPAPLLASEELAGELAEVYAMALLRDERFGAIRTGGIPPVDTMVDALKGMPWFKKGTQVSDPVAHRRKRVIDGPEDLFRGSTPGSQVGPWLSQFLLVGNAMRGRINGTSTNSATRADIRPEDGYVFFGTQIIDQRSVVAKEGVDWLTNWPSWLDTQNGVDFNDLDLFQADRRFISTPRDIATYVHYDALYQAYLVACLIMANDGRNFPKDRGLPETAHPTRAAFASFGGPHILSLVTEVATRALKAVWRQKWFHHRRARPEVVAALLTLHEHDPNRIPDQRLRSALAQLRANIPEPILSAVAGHNQQSQHSPGIDPTNASSGLPAIGAGKNYLLPMAFPEGSPTHPAYGAGHATVAGACVTMLKAFFEMFDENGDEREWPLGKIYEPNAAGNTLQEVATPVLPAEEKVRKRITIQGELDKLAANIAVARNMAGVHYFTDYFASVRQGERVAMSLLEEQMGLYNEPVAMTLTSFDGDRLRLSADDGVHLAVWDRGGNRVAAADWYQRYGG